MYALVAEDRSVLTSGTQARAERRTLLSAALAGAGMGLGLGAAYLAAGLGQQATDHQRAAQIAQAAVSGYDSAHVLARARGLAAGQAMYAHASRTDAVAQKPEAKPRRMREIECLTQAVYYEARGESAQGQFAVAQVVMNRVRHRAFPNSVWNRLHSSGKSRSPGAS